jgi:hypothetical protein
VTTTRLDRIAIFGDQLSFLIPHEWVATEEEGDSYLYHAASADSGRFRASLISIKRGCSSPRKAQEEHGHLFEVGNNLVVAWTKESEEGGDPITHFWWAVGHYHGSKLSHEALFSYTVLKERKTATETLETIEIRGLLGHAEFAPKVESESHLVFSCRV